MSSELAGYATLTLKFQIERNVWVGECLELSTSTYADTLEECQDALDELVETHLDVLDEVGERDRFFDKWGVAVHSGGQTPIGLPAHGSEDYLEELTERHRSGPVYISRVYPVPAGRLVQDKAQTVVA